MRVATSAEKFRATLNRVLLSDGLTIQSTEDLAKTREESSDLKRGMEEAKEVLRRTNKESEEQHRSETKRLRTIIEEYMRLHRPCPPGSVLEDLQTLSSTGQGITAIEREEAWGRMTGTIMSHRAVQEGPYAELEKPLDDQELVHGLEEWRDRCRDPVGLVLFGRILGGDTNQGFIRSAEGHDASLLPSNEASGTRIHPADVRQEFETFWQDLSNPVTGPQGIVPATLDNLDVFNSISFIRIMIVLVDVTCQPRLGGGVASLVSLVPLLCPKGENANGSFSQDSIDDWVNDVNSRTGTQGKNDPVIIGIIRNLPERRGTDMASAYWSMYSINFANRHVALYDWYEDWEISDIRSVSTKTQPYRSFLHVYSADTDTEPLCWGKPFSCSHLSCTRSTTWFPNNPGTYQPGQSTTHVISSPLGWRWETRHPKTSRPHQARKYPRNGLDPWRSGSFNSHERRRMGTCSCAVRSSTLARLTRRGFCGWRRTSLGTF